MDLPELSVTSSESINLSHYEMSEKVEWSLDRGCTDHITPRKSDFVQYRELEQAHSAEIADRKYFKIEGYEGHRIMLNGTLQAVETVETEYHEMLFWLETERSDKELYRIIAQSRPVQMISY